MENPSTPTRLPQRPSARLPPQRSVTLPNQRLVNQRSLTDLRSRRVSSSGPPDPQVETLYSHSSARIVAFTAPSASTNNYGRPTGEADEVGTLPWSSGLERTIGIGQMRIYRPPGSVAFLTCGSVIKPILPKSQCWCVDEEASKFVLLIKRPQYWRIELLMKSSDDKAEAENFKNILSSILFFEKTICPFARGFTVELPEPPKGPIIKKPWRPVEKPKADVVSVVEILPSVEVESADEYFSAHSESSSIFGGNESDATDATPKCSDFPRTSPKEEASLSPSTPCRSRKQPRLTVMTSHSMKPRPRARSPLGIHNELASSSSESFHSTECWHSPISPYPLSPAGSHPVSPLLLTQDDSPLQNKNQRATSFSSPIPQTPSLVYPSDDDTKSVSTISEIATPPRAPRSKSPESLTPNSKTRHRATTSSNSRRRALSPLPSPASIFSPERRRQKALLAPQMPSLQVRKVPGIVIRKTCEILLSPPTHLINIMMGIAAKISAGEWKGGWMIWGVGDSNLSQTFEVDGEEEGELDDYGFEIRKKPSCSSMIAEAGDRGRSRERVEIPGSWEVD